MTSRSPLRPLWDRQNAAAFAGLLVVAGVMLRGHDTHAAVTSIEIDKRVPYAAGRDFPGVGPYERIIGRAHFAVDPNADANRAIVDLPLAPRNAAGLVEFSADVEILAPVDPSRARGTLFYDVNNRGRPMCLRMFNEDADEFLMRQGYIVVWSGWTAEVMPDETVQRLDAPTATDGGRPITGMVRTEIMLDEPATRYSVSNRPWIGCYAPTEQGLDNATLTWRLRESDARVSIPRDQWRIEVERDTSQRHRHVMPMVELVLPAGFEAGYIYELIYEARDPVVQGLGLAGIRDLVSYLRYDTSGENPLVREGQSPIERTIGFGISQSGRCLRVMLYEGFNADEQGRQVFDGLIPHVAGAGLGFFNHRFAMPTRYSTQHTNHLYPCDQFPFAYSTEHDPISGREDGLLEKARAAGVVPKIMHIQNAAEYWHRGGSLVHTDTTGKRDLEIPAEVRIYSIGGAQHGWGDDVTPASVRLGELPNNPTDYRPQLRAALVALDAWIRDGAAPPDSVYPRIDRGTLVGWERSQSGWKPLPGVRYPSVINQPELLDYGPRFAESGILTRHPPARGPRYPVLVPAYGEDNNELGMLLMPAVAVPLATFTGWNLRGREFGAEDELARLRGARVPFPRTAERRKRLGDPRPAVLERYEDFDDYLQHFKSAANEIVDERRLLSEDVPRLLERANAWRTQFDATPADAAD